jgi:hypothetical protein
MRLFLFCFILASHALGQNANQPQKESHLDIRSSSVLFSIVDLDLNKVIWLERTVNLEYFLKMKLKDQERILKLSGKEASSIDREFASGFLKCQYELPESRKDCEVILRLKMKSEAQEICKKEDEKTRLTRTLFQKLDKLFSQ